MPVSICSIGVNFPLGFSILSWLGRGASRISGVSARLGAGVVSVDHFGGAEFGVLKGGMLLRGVREKLVVE